MPLKQDGYDRAKIIAGIRRLERVVSLDPDLGSFCVRFRPRKDDDVYFISIRNGSGCSSYVSRDIPLKMSDRLILGWTCFRRWSTGDIANEIVLC